MRKLKYIALAGIAAFAFSAASPAVSHAQVAVDIGVAPECPYGYYDVAPYNCAPYGYYGPEWFNGGVFIGAGPWFHGPEGFRGHVDNHFHPEHGYHGAMPARGEKARPENNVSHMSNFHGNEMRDGRGHAGGGEKR